jgi:23S rRNA maturation-related 3'-5' exoribonuclease YhaM
VLREKTLQRAEEQAQKRLPRDQENWKERVAAITSDNDATWQRYERKKAEQLTSEDYLAYTQATDHWQKQAALLEQEYVAALTAWQHAKVNFETAAETQRSQITELRNRYLEGDREAIQLVLRKTLQRSRYPTAFPRNNEAHYNPENRVALITLQVPDLQRIAILRDGRKNRPTRKDAASRRCALLNRSPNAL